MQLGLLPAGAHADRGEPELVAPADALVEGGLRAVQRAPPALDLGQGQQEVRARVAVPGRREQLRAEAGLHRRLGVVEPVQAHQRAADGVQPADVEGDAVLGGQGLQLGAPDQRFVEGADERLAVGAVVQHQQLPVDVAELGGQPQGDVVAFARRDVPAEAEAVGQPGQVVQVEGGGGLLAEEVDGADGVLEGRGEVAELLEDGGEHEVGAGEQVAGTVAGTVLGGPAVDLLHLPAGLGHVAAPAQQVGLHQPGAQLQVLPAEVAGGRRGRPGALVQLTPDEPREQLELGHLGRQHGGVDESGHRPIIGPLGA